MKKWLILAAVVAMFAMVFPACGKDEGGIAEASDVQMGLYNDGTDVFVIVTWTGSETGYRYDVVFAGVEGEGGGLFAGGATQYEYVQGQNILLFAFDDEGTFTAVGNDTPSQWSAKIKISELTIYESGDDVLVGVVALSPGGFSFGSKVAWGATADDEKVLSLP